MCAPYRAILDRAGPHRAILGATGPYWSILGHTGLYWTIQEHTGGYWALLGQPGGPPCLRQDTTLHGRPRLGRTHLTSPLHTSPWAPCKWKFNATKAKVVVSWTCNGNSNTPRRYDKKTLKSLESLEFLEDFGAAESLGSIS